MCKYDVLDGREVCIYCRYDRLRKEVDSAHASLDIYVPETMRLRVELANERKAVEWAAENMVCNPDGDVDEYALTADEIRKKAREK